MQWARGRLSRRDKHAQRISTAFIVHHNFILWNRTRMHIDWVIMPMLFESRFHDLLVSLTAADATSLRAHSPSPNLWSIAVLIFLETISVRS